jgi:hypothetical protein
MTVLTFEDYRQMSDYIKAHGLLPVDKEVRVGSRIILPGKPKVSPIGLTQRVTRVSNSPPEGLMETEG